MRKRPLLILILITVILINSEIIGLLPDVTTTTERLELSARDLTMHLRGPRPTTGEVVIVAIDDASFNWTGLQWPWPRDYLAEIVTWLNQAGASVIGLDVLLFEPDSGPQGDQALAEALAESQAAVGLAQIYQDSALSIETIQRPLPIYQDAFNGIGIPKVRRDEDAIVRSVQAYQLWDTEVYYNWSFELVRQHLDIGPPTLLNTSMVAFNDRIVPLHQRKLLVNYAGRSPSYPVYSAAFVPLGDYPAENFKDKIVLIGATTETLQDLYPTPFSATALMPGVEVTANAVDTLLSGQFLRIPSPWVALAMTLAAALLAGMILQFSRPSSALLSLAGILALAFAARWLLLSQTGWIMPLVTPGLTLFLGVILPSLDEAIRQELEKRRIRDLFSRFISPEMVTQLIATQDIDSLNKRTELTVLFADIRGFTTLSEKLDPEAVVALLNPFLEAMTTVIHKHGGTVDKYEGDAVLAFFGEPIPYADHAHRAARTALEMMAALDDLNRAWLAEGRLEQPLQIGTGLNSGAVFVGLIGSRQRVNYTVIGDNVNLAARLQDLTKQIGWPILISEATQERIRDHFETEFVEATTVKGKTDPVAIYKLIAPLSPKT